MIASAISPIVVAMAAATATAAPTAADVAADLSKAGLPIADVRVVTPASDSNRLMGRPGQYTSKVFFADSRYLETDMTLGPAEHSIEAFTTVADAKRRADYITRISLASPMFLQYVYHSGRYVLRLNRVVEPADADAYRAALVSLTAKRR